MFRCLWFHTQLAHLLHICLLRRVCFVKNRSVLAESNINYKYSAGRWLMAVAADTNRPPKGGHFLLGVGAKS